MAVTVSITLSGYGTANNVYIGAGNSSSTGGHSSVAFHDLQDAEGTTKRISANPGEFIYLWSDNNNEYPELRGNGIYEVLSTETSYSGSSDMLLVYKLKSNANVQLELGYFY